MTRAELTDEQIEARMPKKAGRPAMTAAQPVAVVLNGEAAAQAVADVDGLAQLAMGYQTAMQRPCCRNCAHSEQVKPSYAYNDVYPWRCQKGGFGVTANAVCKEHAPARKGGAA